MNVISSRAVSFWDVHLWVQHRIDGIDFPMAGTPKWQALADDDPRKLAAVLDAGQHHSLRVEVAQEQHAQAVKDMAAAVDWSSLARSHYRRASCPAYVPRTVVQS